MYAVLGLTGMRWGEAAALRWRDYEPELEPLGRLHVARSYSTRRKSVGTTKTRGARFVPVHPVLAGILAAWKLAHPAEPGDLVVPSRGDERHRAGERSVSHGRKRLHEDLDRLALRHRRPHDFRRTFVTMARAGGAQADHVSWIVHGPSGSVLDAYTSTPWVALCEAMLCVKVREPGPAEIVALEPARRREA